MKGAINKAAQGKEWGIGLLPLRSSDGGLDRTPPDKG